MIIIGNEAYCHYSSIQKGIDYLEKQPTNQKKKMVILAGDYEETVEARLSNFEMVGIGEVRIIGGKFARQIHEDGNEVGTFRTATVFLDGENIVLKNLNIINQSGQGEDIGQAIALFAYCHNAEFYSCRLEGHQDTLCTGPLPGSQSDGTRYLYCKQLYKNCFISGTVDFIFGGGDVEFIECEVNSRYRPNNGVGYISAACTPEKQERGYIFKHCFLTAEATVENVYLGRPWRKYAQTTFEDCYMGRHIAEKGWDDWGNPDNQLTATYKEISCTYEGAVKRPSWVHAYST